MTVNSLIEILKCTIRVMKTYKNYFRISIILLCFIITSFCNAPVFALQKGSLEYFSNRFDYTILNPAELNIEGDYFFNEASNTDSKSTREKLFRFAMRKYYLATKADFKNVHAYIQMARIYDSLNKDKYAKENFYKATNLEFENPTANYYFGEYYFKRRNYNRALRYYLLSYQNGYENDFELNFKLAVLYEKLGDLENAKNFYTASSKMNPEKTAEYQQKLQQIDSLNYDESEYYYIIRE